MPLLLDTGALSALADVDDAWHIRVRDFLKAERQSLLVPVTVIPEAAYLMRKRLGVAVETRFAESLAAGEIATENLTQRDIAPCAELLHIYLQVPGIRGCLHRGHCREAETHELGYHPPPRFRAGTPRSYRRLPTPPLIVV